MIHLHPINYIPRKSEVNCFTSGLISLESSASVWYSCQVLLTDLVTTQANHKQAMDKYMSSKVRLLLHKAGHCIAYLSVPFVTFSIPTNIGRPYSQLLKALGWRT